MGAPSDLPVERAAGPLPQFRGRLDGLEVTQAVQDLRHSVPLVAQKPTLIRVYVSFSGSLVPAAVRGEIEIGPPGPGSSARLTSMNSVDVTATGVALERRREDLRLSLNVLVPANLLRPGRMSVRLVQLIDAAANTAIPFDGGGTRADVTLLDAPPLRIRLIGLRYVTAQGATVAPSTRDFAMIHSWLSRAYPVGAVEWTQITVDADAAWPFQCGDANAQLAALRAQDVSAGADARIHYYGVVADAGGFMRGCASGIPQVADPTTVASGPTGTSSFGWDHDGCYGDWYAGHELAHTYGRLHPGFCNQTHDDNHFPFPGGQLSDAEGAFVGFDFGDGALGLPAKLYPGPASHDVMTYCNDQWLSSYTYEAIFARLAEENVPGGVGGGGGGVPGGPPSADGARRTAARAAADGGVMRLEHGDFVHVVGRVDLDASRGRIMYVNPVSTATVGGAAASGQPEVTVRVLGSDGKLLVERAVDVKLDTCTEERPARRGIVDVVIPKLSEARTVQLVIRGQVVDTFGTAPSPTGLKLALESKREAGPSGPSAHFSWRAEGAEEQQLRYTVQASTDNGASWQTVAVGRKTPTVSVDASQFPGAKRIKVRVLATDGFNTSDVVSEDVSLETP